MKKHKPFRPLPISQRHLAAYLGVSGTLLSMTATGRHGERELSTAVLVKMSKLERAYVLAEKSNPDSPSVDKIKDGSPAEYQQLGTDLLEEAGFLTAQATILKRKLDQMLQTAQEAERWIRAIESLIAALPNGKQSGKDRLWLEAQTGLAVIKLQKNGCLARVKVETQIETKLAEARIYNAAYKKLMSTVNKPVKGVKVKANDRVRGTTIPIAT